MEQFNRMLRSHKDWISKNADDVSSVRHKYMQIHDLLGKIKQFVGLRDENDENVRNVLEMKRSTCEELFESF